MAGCGAAHRLHAAGVPSVMFEKRGFGGGHTASTEFEGGWVFDEGPHISFTKNERFRAMLADNVDHQYEQFHAKVNNYWKGHWIKHPAQCNLFGLPEDLVVNCLRDFMEAQHQDYGPIRTYADWLTQAFGTTFARTFPMEYSAKYHTTTADNLSTDWIGPRLYRPNIEEVLRGAISASTADIHYIDAFRYPSRGGFVSYIRKFFETTDLRTGHEVVGINPRQKRLRFRNGASTEYADLISSVPLPEIIPLIDGVPSDVLEASGALACSTAVVVSLGIDKPAITDAHWTYFYDRDYFFTRISTPYLQSRHNVPEGCSSIQAECYYSRKYRPLDLAPGDCIQPVVDDLRRCGLLGSDDRVIFSHAIVIPYANVIFDLDRAPALTIVHGYLDDVGISYCGRYGDWGYLWTDESFLSGERAAEAVLSRCEVQ
jgi:protoporphyrinogen oxidase